MARRDRTAQLEVRRHLHHQARLGGGGLDPALDLRPHRGRRGPRGAPARRSPCLDRRALDRLARLHEEGSPPQALLRQDQRRGHSALQREGGRPVRGGARALALDPRAQRRVPQLALRRGPVPALPRPRRLRTRRLPQGLCGRAAAGARGERGLGRGPAGRRRGGLRRRDGGRAGAPAEGRGRRRSSHGRGGQLVGAASGDRKRIIAHVREPGHPLAQAVRRPADWYFTDADRDDEVCS
jgi:hypothetical protein